MNFTLAIDCDNAAFEGDDLATEIARILRDAAQRIEAAGFADHAHGLRDVNGNSVGEYRLVGAADHG